MRDSEAVVTPFMQVATYATRNFAHTIPIFRSGMDFLFIQFAHMPYHHYVQMHKVHWIPNVKSLRIPKILASCGLSNLLHISVYKYQGSRIYPKDSGFLRIVQSLAFLLYTSIKSSYNAHYLCASFPHTHISQIFWFLADYPISCIFPYTSIKVRAYIPKFLVSCGLSNLLHITVCKYQGFRIYVCVVQSFLLYTSIKSSKEFPAYSWVALFSYEKRRQYLP